MKRIIINLTLVLLLNINLAYAEDMYVTDRVMLGVHQSAEENSVLLNSLRSGTKVEIIETEGSFSRIKTDIGDEGWIKTEFLIKEKPSILILGEVTSKLNAVSEELKKLKARATKRDHDLQTREDQVANSKSTITELKRQLAQTQTALASASSGNPTATISTEYSAELEAANSQVETLQKQIEELQNAAIMENVEQDEPTKTQLNSEIKKLLMRIKVAKANLSGEEIPSPEELAAIQPRMPLWYWVLLSMVLILGFVFGTLFIDYIHRKKHGGFRL